MTGSGGSQRPKAEISHLSADAFGAGGSSNLNSQPLFEGPVNSDNLSESEDTELSGNRYQKMAQRGYGGGEDIEAQAIFEEEEPGSGSPKITQDLVPSSTEDSLFPVAAPKQARRSSNTATSPNLHRAGLLQAMASPFLYSPNHDPNSPPPTFASISYPAINEVVRRPSTSASSSSSHSSFVSPRAEDILTGASSTDTGVGHVHASRTVSRAVPHSQNTIRDSTMELSSVLLSSVASSSFPSTSDSFSGSKWTPSTFTPHSFGAFDSTIQVEPRSFTATGDPVARGGPSEAGLQQSSKPAKPGVASSAGQFRSGLSLLLHSSSHSSHPTASSTLDPPQPSRASSQSSVSTITPASSLESFPKDHSGSPTPTSTRTGSPYPALIPPHPPTPANLESSPGEPRPMFPARQSRIRWDPAIDASQHRRSHSQSVTSTATNGGSSDGENAPLLGRSSPESSSLFPLYGSIISKKLKTIAVPNRAQTHQIFHDAVRQSFWAIPAVLLGCLLNILDGVSYGMIIFPTSAPFTTLGPMGVSMFFVSCVLAQVCYTCGGSGFAGASGSMMIEVVPFFHILANSIAREIGEENAAEVIATTIVAYALSSVLTGLSFFLLGALKLGTLITFFPRHILVGCIGGVGAFLIETGLTVSMRIPDDDFVIDLDTFKLMFFDPHNLSLWTIPLGLAILLRIITSKWNHQLIFPVYFVVIPMLFYIIVAAAQLNLGELRNAGWLFDIPGGDGGESDKWWKFYTYLDRNLVHLAPLWSTLPTQFALLFFNILHPPLNVPALSVSLNEDVDTNKELMAHGYSNILAGAVGTVPNYLVYVNTLLFYRVGGGTRTAGFLLAVATTVLLLIGTGPIGYIPVPVVGALIFVLGIDLMKEALWDTRHRVSKMEYITIVSIIVAMTVWDFVVGVLFGIVVSCFFFVVQNSQRRSIRAFLTGETAISTVRRPSAQRAYLKEVSKQTTILRLQGFLFFGTITYVEEAIRGIIDSLSWQKNPVRFLVVDLTLVAGVDMSAAEAFVRIQRLLSAKQVTLVFCGFEVESAVGKALESVGVMGARGVELFSTFNDAMEWTENAYLTAYFRSQKVETSSSVNFVLPGRQDVDVISSYQSPSAVGSPRRALLLDIGARTIANDIRPSPLLNDPNTEPLKTLVRAFSSFGDIDYNQLGLLIPYLQRMSIPNDFILWRQGDISDGLYLIESGVLRATYHFAEHTQSIEESMVPGTLAGELSALSSLPRNAMVIAERAAVLWKLSIENLRLMETEEPLAARAFTQMVLKSAKIDYDTLLAALASRQ